MIRLSNETRKYRIASKILTLLPSLPLRGEGKGVIKEGFKNIGETEEGL
jgi:hypothetical protein